MLMTCVELTVDYLKNESEAIRKYDLCCWIQYLWLVFQRLRNKVRIVAFDSRDQVQTCKGAYLFLQVPVYIQFSIVINPLFLL